MDEIPQRIEQAYGSLSDPDFAVVSAGMEARPYERLMAEIAETFQVTETTDDQDDHGFAYSLVREGGSGR